MMELQSQEVGELAKALATVQGKLAPVTKAGEVDIATKAGGKKQYRFATLVDTWQAIRAACAESGIAVVQLVQVLHIPDAPATPVLVTQLLHSSGQWVRSVCPIRVLGQDAQAFGSAITYARRYALTAAIGIVADDDDDALQASGYPAPQWAPPPPPPALPPPPPPAAAPAPTGDYVSPPAIAQAEAVAYAAGQAPQNDNDTKLANLRNTLAQSNSPAVIEALVDEARRILPAGYAEAFGVEARPRWEALVAQGAAA